MAAEGRDAAMMDQARGSDVEAGAEQPLRRWTDVVPLSACRRPDSLLTSDAAEVDAELARILKHAAAYLNPR